MTVELKPDTELLVRKEIDLGHFRSVDELIDQAVRNLHEQSRSKEPTKRTPAEAIAHIRKIRQGVALEGLKIRDLMNEGRP